MSPSNTRSGRLWFLCAFVSFAHAAPPNVVLIYGDDIGYADVGVNGAKQIPTPNIDTLAAEGLNFTDGHSSSTTCTPSRFSLLTGSHAFRHKVRILPPNAPLSVPTDKQTLATVFKQAGYRTGIIGKWHLGLGNKKPAVNWNGNIQPGPLELGFDESFLIPSTNDRVPCVYLRGHHVVNLDPSDPLHVGRKLADVQNKPGTQYPDGLTNREAMTVYKSSFGHNNSVINGIGRIGYMSGGQSALWNDEHIADDLVREAAAFISNHRDTPFFLYFSSPDIHVPRTPHPRFQGKTKLGVRGDAMVQFDWSVGRILHQLDRYGLTENTLVIFTSDNGPTYDNGYFDGSTVSGSSQESDHGHDASGIWRGGKNMIFEGGTRVPLILRWPSRIKAGTSHAMVNQIDFIASFAELLDVELETDAARDSRSTLAAFLGEADSGHEFMIEEGTHLALRQETWKYAQATRIKQDGERVNLPESLFDLRTDPGEQSNVIQDHPERAAAMKKKLNDIVRSNGLRR